MKKIEEKKREEEKKKEGQEREKKEKEKLLLMTTFTPIIIMEPRLQTKGSQSFNSFPIFFKSLNSNFFFKQIAISFSMQFFSKYGISNLELLIPLWKQV